MTAGHRCEQHTESGQFVTGKACSWPARLQASLASRFPTASVEMLNLAMGGTTTSVILAGIGLVLRGLKDEGLILDAVIIDTLINDSSEAKVWDDSGNLSFKAEQVVSLSYEALVRGLHELVPNVALFSFLSGCPTCHGFADSQRNISTFYDLPRVDYDKFSLAYRNFVDIWKPSFQTDYKHPEWQTHQIIADVVANVWGRVWAKSCASHTPVLGTPFPRQTYEKPEDLALFQPCLNILSGYSARQAFDGKGPKPKINSGWRLFEDRPGKPGWIAEQKGSSLSFNLSFGVRPRLAVVYLRSYEGMGNASLNIDGRRRAALDGLWSDDFKLNVSQSYVAWYTGAGFGKLPYSTADMTVTTEYDSKFKLLQVMSC